MSEVILLLRDVSFGMARQFGVLLYGGRKQLEAIWHTSLIVFGDEVFFGGGINIAPPSAVVKEHGPPLKQIVLGSTSRTKTDLIQFVRDNNAEFSMEAYNVLNHNCNHFTDKLIKFLLPSAGGLDPEILHQAHELGQTPIGKMVVAAMQKYDAILGPSPVTTVTTTTSSPIWATDLSPFGGAFKQLWHDESMSPSTKEKAIDRLKKIGENVLQNATDPKYRRLNAASHVLTNEVLFVPFGEECLQGLGFKKSAEGEATYYQMGPINKETLVQLKADIELINRIRSGGPSVALPGDALPPMIPHFGGFNPGDVNSPAVPALDSTAPHTSSSFTFGGSGQASMSAASATGEPQLGASVQTATSTPDFTAQLEQLAAMGFSNRELCESVLRECNGDLNLALDKLFTMQSGC